MNKMKRKPPGGPKPRNTLNERSPGVNPLAMVTSRGQNVSTEPIKRQKTSHVILDDVVDDMPDDEFFSRGLQGRTSTNLGRQPSISAISAISINSQENPSQRSYPFGYDEARNVHATLKSSQKKGRKPKSGATQHSSPPRYGAITDPVPVDDDDDDIQFVDNQHNTPRLAQNRTVPWSPSPPLAGTFKRDEEEPEPAPKIRQAQSKLINKMQSASNTSRTRQPPQFVEDSSGDELSREPTRKPVRIRSASPNNITSTHFTTKLKKPEATENLTIPLRSLRMMAGSWENLHIIYSWAHKSMQFTKNGEMLRGKGGIIQLSNHHASSVCCSLKNSTEVILQGSKGAFSRGRISFDFDTVKDRDAFLEAVQKMNPKALRKDLES
jgi:hypothetical protein